MGGTGESVDKFKRQKLYTKYKNNTDLNIENLFAKSNNLEAIELDIDVPQAQEVKITSVDGFQIDTMSAIQELRSRIVSIILVT